MADIQLALVDLDNVRGTDTRPLDQLWFTENTDDSVDPDATPCVVVFAMNLKTADHHVTYATLGAFAERIAALIASAPLVGFEVALPLVVKESADAALERLFASAPVPAHQGALAAVHLVTGDLGLREAIGSKLPSKTYLHEQLDLTSSWRATGRRKAPRKPAKPGLDGLRGETPAHPHFAIRTRADVSQLARRPVDVARASALHEIAGLVEHRPGLLTQLGLTDQSIWGVHRMYDLAGGTHPTLGPLDPSDGVEVCADVLQPGEYADPMPSPLGAGAVRFESPPGTLVTVLPTSVVLAADGPWTADLGVLDHREFLGRVDGRRLASSEIVKVRFAVAGDRLVTEARRAFGKPLAGWWWDDDGPHSKPSLRHSGLNIKGRFTVHARCALDSERPEVLLRAPFDASVTAQVDRTTEALVPGKVNGIPVACLLPAGTSPGEVRVTPIQNTTDSHLKRRLPQYRQHFQHLRRLPLLVPA